IAEACNGSSAGEFRLYFAAQPGLLEARRGCGDRREARLADLQSGRTHSNDAPQGRRVSPFRLERLLVSIVAPYRPRVSREAVSDHTWYSILANLYRGYEPPIRLRREFTRSSSPRRSLTRPATRGLTRFTAGRKASTSAPSVAPARMVPTDRLASSSW